MLNPTYINIFKRPFHKDTLDAWCKILDDVSKVAILSVPVVIYSQNTLSYKTINSIMLIISTYLALYSADFVRKNKQDLTENLIEN